MTYTRFKYVVCFLATLTLANMMVAQQSGPTPTGSPASPPPGSSQSGGGSGGGGVSSGTYSIEAEIFAYKSLQSNSQAIATDVAKLLPVATVSTTDDTATSQQHSRPKVVVVPSVSVILPAFQLWRSNMLVIQNFLNQAGKILPVANLAGCPAQAVPGAGAPSFAAYATGVSQAVGVIQSIISLFASSQSVTEFPGTIQDQALISAVARELRAKEVKVLAPDIFAPWMIDVATPSNSVFISKLTELIDALSRLQDVYQCNQLTLGAGTQLQQAETTREADFAKLLDSSLTAANRTAVINEIRSLTSQIAYLRLELGLAANNQSVINSESAITTAEQTLNDSTASVAQKTDALNIINKNDAAIISSLENPLVTVASLTGAKAQSLVAGIEGYLAGLTGGAVSFTPPAASTSASPTGSAASPAAAPTGAASAASPAAPPSPAGATGANTSPAASSTASSTPPIVTILQTDGLARKMDVRLNDQKTWSFEAWRILWLKSMESGGAIVTESNIFGSHPHFGGGAVSGYALFRLDGTLVCSGNAAAYGGYVKPKDFVKKNASVGAVEMLNLGGSCTPDASTASSNP